MPTYTKSLFSLNHIAIQPQTVVVQYDLKESEHEQTDIGFSDFTLQFYRDSITNDAESMLSGRIEQHGLQPWEADGIYYLDVGNGSETLKNFKQFFWVKDGCLFFMELTTEAITQIEQNDPEALYGSLFELEKINIK